ncbi:helix-turn-helix transcriptional regulator [Citrobacter rodentium]|jgi:Response regulator containing a CheY-like receiver domain and an HTH DNA-binding domain|uniref:LuxR-family transcriptional regulator n=2 Tax=Citrobacter rodentium TaxID=67825 RepID=D2TIS1_CITRI|nr:LuxR C-terminal-related transcriptional regulator [Citrobacter rodentium]KIQ50968.1 LuxR family transcriptional regulator [Citrobacter rodentium]QBY30428.1 response regulator transcription factor [Citrobacter rodentium]UHO32202.1 LuxR C-terminal-related transcriptional regulator [Citrobacter rodentium NBRC 105723 = DSM 16636]CBG90831.1 putative LuxR-family transcriptional regulator [Citrobacter rodentium ICC168]
MQIFSGDTFFVLGIKKLLIILDIPEPEGLIFLDTGQDYIYVLDRDEIRHLVYSDPVSAFILCRRSLMHRAAGTNIFSKLLSGWRFGCSKRRHPTILTTSEALIIRMICLGISQKHIATKLHISEKTVSTHKLNALRKLRIKNVAIFFTEYAAWYRLWDQYMNTYHGGGLNVTQQRSPENRQKATLFNPPVLNADC